MSPAAASACLLLTLLIPDLALVAARPASPGRSRLETTLKMWAMPRRAKSPAHSPKRSPAHSPKRSPAPKPTSPPRHPRASPPRPKPTSPPHSKPTRNAQRSPRKTAGLHLNLRPACYHNPYNPCRHPFPTAPAGVPQLLQAPATSGALAAATDPVLLPPGTYVTLIVGPADNLYLAGNYTFDTLMVLGYLGCGPPTGPQPDINLTLNYMSVSGFFQCGKPSAPYTAQVTITLTGAGSDESKAILVTGNLMLVGRKRVAWTQITSTILAGNSSFTTLKPVDWLPGERLLVTPTDYKPDNCEERIITNVTSSGTGSLVSVSAPFSVPHWGTLQTYNNTGQAPSVLDERAEVALLNRNILIQGAADSEDTKYGGIVTMVEGAHAWIRDAMFYRMGHKGVMGRYPVHWHLARDRTGDYLRNSVIWKSWNRCMSIHATDNVIIDTTVCYDHIGHGYMLEDSCEIANIFRNNLGVRTRRPATLEEAVIDTDFTSLATYWIVNPLNHFINNVAVASDNSGYWIMLPNTPIHYCKERNMRPEMNPQKLSLGAFTDNSAHSSVAGLVIDAGICNTPRAPACGGMYDPQDVPQVTRFRAYKNTHSFRTAWVIMNKVVLFDGCVFGDNGGSVLLAGRQVLSRSLVVGQSANILTDTTLPAKMGFALYDGPAGMLNCHFAGFEKPGFQAIRVVDAAFKRWNAFISGTTFDPLIPKGNIFKVVGNRTNTDISGTALVDMDGSLTNRTMADGTFLNRTGVTLMSAPNNTLYPSIYQDSDFNVPPNSATVNCTFDTVWQMYLCTGVNWGTIRLLHDLNITNGTPARIIEVVRSDARRIVIDNANRIWYQFLAIVDTNITYTVNYRNANSFMWNAANGAPSPFQVELKFTDTGAATRITLQNLPLGAWSYYVYDCINKVVVYTAVNNSTLVLPLTASGPPSGPYPNQKNGEARVKVCSWLPCTC